MDEDILLLQKQRKGRGRGGARGGAGGGQLDKTPTTDTQVPCAVAAVVHHKTVLHYIGAGF